MAISFLQELDAGIDASLTSTNRTKQYTTNISSGSLLLAAFSTYSANPDVVSIQDDKSNTWTLIGRALESGTGRGCAVYYAWANAGSVGAMPIVTFNKNTVTCVMGASVLELAGVHADVLDTTTVTDDGVDGGPAQVALGSTAYTDDAIMAVLSTPGTTWVTATPNTGWTDSVANTLTGVVQHKIQKRLVTASGSYTPGWTLNNTSQWAVVGFALKGSTTLPTITGSSSATPRNGATLTIAGVNFGGSAGTITLGGITQTATSWTDTAIDITVDRGTNKYGVALSAIVTTSGAVVSNTFAAVTGLLPQTDWSYVNLITVHPTAAYRLEAVADIASGDQIAFETVGDLATVNNDGSITYDPTVGSMDFEVWTPSEWGTTATITFGSSPHAAPDGVSAAFAVGTPIMVTSTATPAGVSAQFRIGTVTVTAQKNGVAFAANGSTLGICASLPATFDQGGFEDLTYTQIRGVRAIGDIGKQKRTVTYNTIGAARPYQEPSGLAAATLQIELIRIANEGQRMLRDSIDTGDNYSFKFLASDESIVYFTAHVISRMHGGFSGRGIADTKCTLDINSVIVEV